MISRFALQRNIRLIARCYSEVSKNPSQSSSNPLSSASKADVPGLSSAVIQPASQPVGPGVDPNKTGAYKVPEYFCYDSMSFFEAEIEMAKYRLPQPSALKK